MLIKIKPKSIVTAYHCLACGAPCRPNDLYCSYCKQRYDRRFTDSVLVSSSRARLLVKNKMDYVYFPLFEVTEYDFRPLTDITISEDGHYRRYIHGIKDPGDDITTIVTMTDDMRRKLAHMQKDLETDFKIEIAGFNNSFSFKGYTSHISQEFPLYGIGAQSELHVVPTGFIGWKPMPTEPTDLTCPNCGAPIKSRFGCCDYCTGWVEWVDEIA